MDTIDQKRRSENMRRIHSTDTAPELAVRRLLHGLGYRYRLHRKELPGSPDLVFASRRKVILVHGCFWHAHTCKGGHPPKTNQVYWSAKLTRNVERDARNQSALRALGWDCLVVWECQIRAPALDLKKTLVAFLEGRRATSMDE